MPFTKSSPTLAFLSQATSNLQLRVRSQILPLFITSVILCPPPTDSSQLSTIEGMEPSTQKIDTHPDQPR